MEEQQDAVKELEKQFLKSNPNWLYNFDDFMRFEESKKQKTGEEYLKFDDNADYNRYNRQLEQRQGERQLAAMTREVSSSSRSADQQIGGFEDELKKSDPQEEITMMLREKRSYKRNRQTKK